MAKATDKAYEWVREHILSGAYPAGSHLQEARIAEEARVSRTPVREALRRLSNEHFVRFVPNQGAFVATWRDDDVEVIFELRAMLEGYAAQRAAERITPAQIDELARCADEIERLCRHHSPENHRRSLEYNQRFHAIVTEATGSDRMQRMLAWLVEMPLILRTMDRYSNEDVERSNRHHRELVEAFRARDGNWARSVMEAHLRAARQVYLSRGTAAGSAPRRPAQKQK
jgi:DNA-binding GntR family transcriptional regulator